MADEPFTAVGRIAKTHGLKGEVSVIAYSEASLDVLTGLDAWLVPPPAALRSTRIAGVRPGPKGPIVTLEGCDGIDAARTLVGSEVLVATESLPTEWLEAAEEELPEVLGMHVTDEVHGDLGEIVEYIETGANDVWVVEGPRGEVLIPVIEDVVIEVDEEAGEIVVRLLPGLLPEESEEA